MGHEGDPHSTLPEPDNRTAEEMVLTFLWATLRGDASTCASAMDRVEAGSALRAVHMKQRVAAAIGSTEFAEAQDYDRQVKQVLRTIALDETQLCEVRVLAAKVSL